MNNLKKLYNYKTTKDGPIPSPVPRVATQIETDSTELPDAFPDNAELDTPEGSNLLNENVASDNLKKSIPVKELLDVAVDILKKSADKLVNRREAFPDNRESIIPEATNVLNSPKINDAISQAALPMKELLDVAVDILKKNTETKVDSSEIEDVSIIPMNDLVNIAADILKQSMGESSDDETYTMPKSTVRYKDLKITVTNKDNGQEQPESTMSTVTVLYDDVNDKLKITGYKIDNESKENEIMKELDLGEINIRKLQDSSTRTETIEQIITQLKEQINIAPADEDELKGYLENLGKVIDVLHNTVNKAS
jgi:hypothetical protein